MANILSSVGRVHRQKSPTILTGLGIVAMGAAVVAAVKATPKAAKAIEVKRTEKADAGEKFKVRDVFESTWKHYVPTAVWFVVGTACIIGGHSVNERRNAALAGLYSISETALKDYKVATKAIVGEEKEKEISQRAAEKRIETLGADNIRMPVSQPGDISCVDAMTNQPFVSSPVKLRAIENDFNYRLNNGEDITFNEYRDAVGLRPVSNGDDLLWYGNEDQVHIRIEYVPDEHEMPIANISFDDGPRYIERRRW